MNQPLRKLLGVAGIGLGWAPVWGAVFATIVLIIGILRPQDIGPGEEPVVGIGIGLVVGFVSGSAFGLILSFAEDRKPIRDLSLVRVAIWGTLAAAVWPLLTPVDDRMVFILCPLGALCAVVSVAIARKAAIDPDRPSTLARVGRLIAGPMRAACASNGTT